MKWVVTNVPTWLVGVVLIGGLPALAVLIKLVISRRATSLAKGSHNDVAGFLLAIVAVVYAVIVGFTIVSLYEASVTANQDVSTEAAELLQLHEGNVSLDSSTRARIDADVVAYANSVVDNWALISKGNASSQVQTSLNDIYVTLGSYTPHTAAQADYLTASIADVNLLSQARVTRQLEASDSGSVPLVLWIGILLTSGVTLAFTLVFSLEDVRVASAMVAGVTAVLAVNIFVLIELSYPFLGSVAVGPEKFEAIIHLVGR
jgi:uncharacterized protein DUF4239